MNSIFYNIIKLKNEHEMYTTVINKFLNSKQIDIEVNNNIKYLNEDDILNDNNIILNFLLLNRLEIYPQIVNITINNYLMSFEETNVNPIVDLILKRIYNKLPVKVNYNILLTNPFILKNNLLNLYYRDNYSSIEFSSSEEDGSEFSSEEETTSNSSDSSSKWASEESLTESSSTDKLLINYDGDVYLNPDAYFDLPIVYMILYTSLIKNKKIENDQRVDILVEIIYQKFKSYFD